MSFDLDDFGVRTAVAHECSQCPRCKICGIQRWFHQFITCANTVGHQPRVEGPFSERHSCGCTVCEQWIEIHFSQPPRFTIHLGRAK